jgi:hypothetical protein
MDTSLDILSEITVYSKYAKYLPEQNRRESWAELVARRKNMDLKKYPLLKAEIEQVYNDFVLTKKILPSMRSMQFAGRPIDVNPSRIFNCSYAPIDHYKSFQEAMFLLLGGTGFGYSVQSRHVSKLPDIRKPVRTRRYLIGDSIEGWADSIGALMKSYFTGSACPEFDFSDIRDKGALLVTTGGKAPGPEPLRICLAKIKELLDSKPDNTKLASIEVHDILCYIADAVLAGGIRRAACICLFDLDDNDMIKCKSDQRVTMLSIENRMGDACEVLVEDSMYGKKHRIFLSNAELEHLSKTNTVKWYHLFPHRGRANNSAVIVRHKVKKKDFSKLWKDIEASGSGEPAVYLTNNPDAGTNPCCFASDMLLKTLEGWKTFYELAGKTVEVYNKDGQVHKGSVWSNGIKPIVAVKLSNGKVLRCTDDHRFMLTNGQEQMARDLRGSKIMPYLEFNTVNDEHVKLGFMQGDASLTRLNSTAHKGLEVHLGQDDKDVADLFEIDHEDGIRSYYVNGYNDALRDLGFVAKPLPERTLPSGFSAFTPLQKASFMKGLYSANGSVIKAGRVSFKSTCNELVLEMSEYLLSVGIENYITTNKAKNVAFSNGTYLCKQSYDLNIASYESLLKFAKSIGFVHAYKMDALKTMLLSRAPVVVSVKPDGEEEVFDFNIQDSTHWGIVSSDANEAGGYIAHNCEIALLPYQFCNLVEVNASTLSSQQDLDDRVKAATFLGTLQAGYTNFHYLRDVWRKTTEKEALLGVSMTGICSGAVNNLDLTAAANAAVAENKRVAAIIGIREAARITCVKPAGTTSLVLGTSSGIHAWHSPYYLRRIRVGKNESLYKYLAAHHPTLVEDEYFSPSTQAVIQVPVKAPEGAIFRDESALDLLNRVKRFSVEWIQPGHIKGDNTHNVSATVSIKPNEWEEVGNWMWENRAVYNGISVLPHDGGTYIQAPFEDITEERYNELIQHLNKVDLSNIRETEDTTDLKGEVACAGGACELTF